MATLQITLKIYQHQHSCSVFSDAQKLFLIKGGLTSLSLVLCYIFCIFNYNFWRVKGDEQKTCVGLSYLKFKALLYFPLKCLRLDGGLSEPIPMTRWHSIDLK